MQKLIYLKNLLIQFFISILKELDSIYSAVGNNDYMTVKMKFEASIKLSLLLSPLLTLPMVIWTRISAGFISWLDLNFAYLMLVFGAIMIDHAFGTYKHLKIDKDFNWQNNIKGLFLKLTIAICGAFLFEGIDHIITKETIIKDYIQMVCRLIVFLYPAGSAFGNMSVVTNGKFPPKSWIDRLNKFNENLNPNELKAKEE